MILSCASLLLLSLSLSSSFAQQKESPEENAEEVPKKQSDEDEVLSGEKLLAAQVNAITVLNMIKALEAEMEVVDHMIQVLFTF